MAQKQTSKIVNAVIEYYLLEYGAMATLISPSKDADLVCNVADRVYKGTFRRNVVYGKGEYFHQHLGEIEDALKRSSLFKDIPNKEGDSPSFRYVGGKQVL